MQRPLAHGLFDKAKARIGLAADELVARIKDATDIVELIGEYVSLQRAGSRYKGLCPFHVEKTPSFTVHPQMGIFHCFGCHAGGDVFEFIMRHEALSFPETLELLARRAGIPLPRKQGDASPDRLKAILEEIHSEAQLFFVKQMKESQEGRKAMDYLRSRSVPEPMWDLYGLGYAPNQWRGLMGVLSSKGYDVNQQVQSGLVVQKEGNTYDRFRDRITFPITRGKGRCVAFGGRALDSENPAKYINSPTTAIYNKGHMVYGFDQARSALCEANEVIVAEGYLDVILCAAAGVNNTVAPLGTAMTREQAQLLRRHCDRMIVLFDADSAGQEASFRALEVCVEEGFQVRVASLPKGMDPADVVVNRGPEALKQALRGAEGLVRMRIARHGLSRNADVQDKVAVLEELLPILAKVRNEVELESYLGEIAERLAVSEAVVRRELGRFRRVGKVDGKTLAWEPKPNGTAVACKGLLSLAIHFPHLREGIFHGLEEVQVRDDTFGSLLKKAEQLQARGCEWDAATLLREAPEELQGTLSSLVMDEAEFADPGQTLKECLDKLAEVALRARMRELKESMRLAQEQGRFDEVARLQRQWLELKRTEFRC